MGLGKTIYSTYYAYSFSPILTLIIFVITSFYTIWHSCYTLIIHRHRNTNNCFHPVQKLLCATYARSKYIFYRSINLRTPPCRFYNNFNAPSLPLSYNPLDFLYFCCHASFHLSCLYCCQVCDLKTFPTAYSSIYLSLICTYQIHVV